MTRTPAPTASGVPPHEAAAPFVREAGRPPVVRAGRRLGMLFDRMIGAWSLIANDPVLDIRDFTWTKALRDDWQAIRDEARAVMSVGDPAPCHAAIPPDRRAIAGFESRRRFFLHGDGRPVLETIDRCPRTAAAVACVPGLVSAFFSVLAPGTHAPARRGVTKGLVTCHLGLIVPRDGDVRMRVGDRVVRWAEGETLLFDDTYDHEVWNEAGTARVVLLLRFERPLAQPGKWFAGLVMGTVRRSASVRADGCRSGSPRRS